MNTVLLDAMHGKPTPYTPVWYMRQAGRYLPEYQKAKGKRNIFDVIKIPELAAEIALQPIKRFAVDGAIVYADIMLPLLGMGIDVQIVEGVGPVIAHPIEKLSDITALRALEPEKDIPFLHTAIKLVRRELTIPLIGFAGAPFTLASYVIEGKPSRDFIKTKRFLHEEQKAWHLLMEKLSDMTIVYFRSQVAAGAQILQLFDSWVGYLSREEYMEYVFPYTKKIFHELQKLDVPLIHFGTNTAKFLKAFASVECDVVGIDWRISIPTAWKIIGFEKSIQGNLDPSLLLGNFSKVRKEVDSIFATLPKKDGYIFNLGHGILPNTPIDNILCLTDYIHSK